MLKRGWLILAFVVLTGCAGAGGVQPGQAPIFEPTETPVPLVTPTAVPAAPVMDIPKVNWEDVSLFKKAMKPNYEGDVDQVPTANRYLIIARLDIETDAVLRGAERVRYTNHSPDTLNEIAFRLYPNAPALGGHMTVTHVTVNGDVVTPALYQLDSVLKIPLAKPLHPKESVEMTLDFNAVVTRGLMAAYGRLGYVNGILSGTAWYPTLSVYDIGPGWWMTMPPPWGDPAYTETGLYDVRLTLPSDMTYLASGIELETTPNADKTITHHSVTGPMRDFAFQASARYMVSSTDVDGIKINVMHYKDTASSPLDGTPGVLKFATTAVTTFDQTFSEYPYREMDVVENPTTAGGIEYPGLLQINDRYWIQGEAFLEVVVAHEIGHQWFYAMVGNNQVEHPWLDESLTAFTEIVYMRAAYPTGPKAQEYVDQYQRRYNSYTGSGQFDAPLDLPVGSYTGYSYVFIVYTKGPLFYVEIERQVGRETLYKALHEYFRRYKYVVVTSGDMLHTLNDVSGKDLTPVFSKWVGNAYLQDVSPNVGRLDVF